MSGGYCDSEYTVSPSSATSFQITQCTGLDEPLTRELPATAEFACVTLPNTPRDARFVTFNWMPHSAKTFVGHIRSDGNAVAGFGRAEDIFVSRYSIARAHAGGDHVEAWSRESS